MEYQKFLKNKTQLGGFYGFDPTWIPDKLFDFQKSLVEWSCKKGRSAIYADCGLGKTFMQIAWAENVIRKTNGRVLILTPLAVSFQTVKECEKIGVESTHARNGITGSGKLFITNYERLAKFNSSDFVGVVCDESSILKNFDGETRKAVTEFMRTIKYRLLCTATAAPNDYIELGTSSEAIGDLGATDMVNRFFRKAKNTTTARQEKMSGIYELRSHAEKDFWRWICSWARAVRCPMDIGFDNKGFDLPKLITRSHVVKASTPRDGYLFDIPAVGLSEQRNDLMRTTKERCEMAADLVNSHSLPAVSWCNLNKEGDMLKRLIPDSVQVSGSDTDDHKEGAFNDFVNGGIRVLITKPTIGGFGLNLQHCAHETFFPSHSYEQYYQAVRRCWRFGQKNNVVVDMITTDGQENVLKNLERKSLAAEKMFNHLVSMMWNELKITKKEQPTKKEELPSWL